MENLDDAFIYNAWDNLAPDYAGEVSKKVFGTDADISLSERKDTLEEFICSHVLRHFLSDF